MDEWFFYPLKETETRDIPEIIDARDQPASTIFCLQFDVPGFYDKFSGTLITDAICDRIAHDSYRILIDSSEFMRKRSRAKAMNAEFGMRNNGWHFRLYNNSSLPGAIHPCGT